MELEGPVAVLRTWWPRIVDYRPYRYNLLIISPWIFMVVSIFQIESFSRRWTFHTGLLVCQSYPDFCWYCCLWLFHPLSSHLFILCACNRNTSNQQNSPKTKVVGSEWTWDVQICAKTFTTDRGPSTYRYPIFTHPPFNPGFFFLGGVRHEISEKYFTWPREIYPPQVFFWASKRHGGGSSGCHILAQRWYGTPFHNVHTYIHTFILSYIHIYIYIHT